MHKRPLRLIGTTLLALTTAVSAAACGGETADPQAAPASVSAAPATTAAPAATPSPSATEAEDCLVGTWTVPPKDLARFYKVVTTHHGQPLDAAGAAELRFTEKNRYEYTVDLQGEAEGMTVTMAAVISGEYRTDGSTITTKKDKSQVKATGDVGGQKIDASGPARELFASSPIASVPYTCAGGVPTIEFSPTGKAADRMSIALQEK